MTVHFSNQIESCNLSFIITEGSRDITFPDFEIGVRIIEIDSVNILIIIVFIGADKG